MTRGEPAAPPPKDMKATIQLIVTVSGFALAASSFAMTALKDDRAEIRETESRFREQAAQMATMQADLAAIKCRVGMIPGCTATLAQAQTQGPNR